MSVRKTVPSSSTERSLQKAVMYIIGLCMLRRIDVRTGTVVQPQITQPRSQREGFSPADAVLTHHDVWVPCFGMRPTHEKSFA